MEKRSMFELRKSKIEEADAFVIMESSQETSKYIIPYSREKHIAEMQSGTVIYLSIYNNNNLSGFIILVPENASSIEFRRIVVSAKGNGLGQLAMNAIENYCAQELGCSRIWLDVFEFNSRGMHIYKKLGYKQFKASEHHGNRLLFMEKYLRPTS